MLAEEESKISNRFLYVNCRFGKEAIEIWQQETISRFLKKNKNDAYFEYLKWKETHNEIALFTMYAYADFYVPKKFNCIFNYKNPEIFCESKMTLTQSIWEGWLPMKRIEHGYKHLAIFKFEEEIPKLINDLYLEQEKFSSLPNDYFVLGICQFNDYNSIKKRLITIKQLKEKYGKDWSDFHNEDE